MIDRDFLEVFRSVKGFDVEVRVGTGCLFFKFSVRDIILVGFSRWLEIFVCEFVCLRGLGVSGCFRRYRGFVITEF